MNALKRRLRPSRTAPTAGLPEVWPDDDGEDYWAMGHIEPHTMVLAVAVQHLLDAGTAETVELLFSTDILLARAAPSEAHARVAATLAAVEQLWHLDLDDELWHPCTASHPDARPVTRMPCW